MKELTKPSQADLAPRFLSPSWLKELVKNPKAIGILTLAASPLLVTIYGLAFSSPGAVILGGSAGLIEGGCLKGITKSYRRARWNGLTTETVGGVISRFLGPPFYHPIPVVDRMKPSALN